MDEKDTNKLDTLAKDFDRGLMQELECPVCMEYMKPPILMCENGHNICSNCRPKLDCCPSCRKSFLQVRNLALESLSRVVTNAQPANESKAPAPKKYPCPFAKISNEDCSWNDTLAEMQNHILRAHNEGNDIHETNGPFNVILTELDSTRHYRKAVLLEDKMFYVVWEIRDGNFFCIVLFIGPKKKSTKFKYKFSLSSDDNMKNISMSFQTRSVVQNVDQLLNFGDCVSLHYETVLKFRNSNHFLRCDFEITCLEPEGATGPLKPPLKPKPVSSSDASTSKVEFLGHPESPSALYFPTPEQRFMTMEALTASRFGRPGRCRPSRRARGGRHGLFERHHEGRHPGPLLSLFNRGTSLKQTLSRRLGWSMTDLSNEMHYKDEQGSTTSGDSKSPSSPCSPSTRFSQNLSAGRTPPMTPSAPTDMSPDSPTSPSTRFSQNLSAGRTPPLTPSAPTDMSPNSPSSPSTRFRTPSVTPSTPTDKPPNSPSSPIARFYQNLYVGRKSPVPPSPMETWNCTLCGHDAPKRDNQAVSPIAPPGAHWVCKLCGQWRP